MRNLILNIVTALFLFSAPSLAQKVRVKASLKDDTLKIGEQTAITLTAVNEGKSEIIFPEPGDTLSGDIEVIEAFQIDSSIKENMRIYTRDIKITAFDSGSFNIPPFQFIIQSKGQTDSLLTNPLKIYFRNVVVDTSQAPKDIKNVRIIPEPILPSDYTWLWWLLLLLPLAGLLYYLLKMKKPAAEPVAPPAPVIPPHIKAKEELDKLEQEKLWQKDQHKNYHSRLSEIVRTYIEGRFGLPALEQTTNELLPVIKKSPALKQEDFENLAQMLQLADMVKFAKYTPISTENELSMKNAKLFTLNTQIEDQQNKEA